MKQNEQERQRIYREANREELKRKQREQYARKKEKFLASETKTIKVKITEDKVGRTAKFVGKNWDKQLAEIKRKIAEYERTN